MSYYSSMEALSVKCSLAKCNLHAVLLNVDHCCYSAIDAQMDCLLHHLHSPTLCLPTGLLQ